MRSELIMPLPHEQGKLGLGRAGNRTSVLGVQLATNYCLHQCPLPSPLSQWRLYTAVAKDLGLCLTTVRAIISKWSTVGALVNHPRSGWPGKIPPRAQ